MVFLFRHVIIQSGIFLSQVRYPKHGFLFGYALCSVPTSGRIFTLFWVHLEGSAGWYEMHGSFVRKRFARQSILGGNGFMRLWRFARQRFKQRGSGTRGVFGVPRSLRAKLHYRLFAGGFPT
jgi:hypothetical protein